MYESTSDNSRKTRTPWGYCHTKYMAVLSRLSPNRWGNHAHDHECQRANAPEFTQGSETTPNTDHPPAAAPSAFRTPWIHRTRISRGISPLDISSLSTAHRSQGRSLSVWRALPQRNNSKPISNEHFKSLNLNPNPPHQIQRIHPLSQIVFYLNVLNLRENDWPVRSVSEGIPMIITRLEGQLHLHPPLTLRMVTMNSVNLHRRDSILLHRGRKEPSNPRSSSQ